MREDNGGFDHDTWFAELENGMSDEDVPWTVDLGEPDGDHGGCNGVHVEGSKGHMEGA